MSFAPHCGHFLLYIKILLETLGRNKKKSGETVEREKTANRKEKTSEKITIVFHLKEKNMKNVIYINTDNKRFFMK